MKQYPPRWMNRLLDFFCDKYDREIIKGDMIEMYKGRLDTHSRFKNNLHYFFDVIKCLRPGLLKKPRNQGASQLMFQNYLKLSFRNFKRNRSYSIINLAGFSFGMLVFIIIVSYLHSELSYDRFHKKADRIYRLVLDLTVRGEEKPWAIITGRFVGLAKEEIPEVEDYVRLIPSWGDKNLITYRDGKFYETKFGWADPSIFKIFDIELITGNPNQALVDPNTVVVSESIAKKLFGNENPLGKIINRDNQTDYTITGVFRDIPENSHFTFDYLASLMSATQEERDRFWGYSYILSQNLNSSQQLNQQINELYEKHKKPGTKGTVWVQPLSDIHLHSDLMYEFQANGNLNNIYVLGATALLIIFLASINFINLSIVMGIKRIREVGMRKVLGASKLHVMLQFLFESVLTAFAGFLIAWLISFLVIEQIQTLTGESIILNFNNRMWLTLGLGMMSVLTGLIAGIYPALYVSAFSPIKILKGVNPNLGGVKLRKFLVGFQFAISILLLVSVITIHKQVKYLHSKELGFNKEQLLAVPLNYTDNLINHNEAFKNDLLNNSGISNVSFMSNLPGELIQMWVGTVSKINSPNEDSLRVKFFTTDHDFIKTLGINMISGRDFNQGIITDTLDAVLINESAEKALGFPDPLGAKIHLGGRWDRDFTIIGVMEDFHFASLHYSIEPLLVFIHSGNYNKVVITLNPGQIELAIAHLEKVWSQYEPDRPAEYFFLDYYFDQKYQKERSAFNMVLLFTISGILIACFGLYGLATYVLQLRLKEIGIRKILGASMSNLLGLLVKDFILLVVIAAIVISPAAYILMDNWLRDFAYKISLDYQIFLWSGAIVLISALLTICRTGFSVASSNPIHTLKSE